MVTGGCLCGKNTYQLTGKPVDCSYCHCTVCRRLTGSAFGAYGSVSSKDFTWQTGSEYLSCYRPTELTRRYFCQQCGCFLLTEHSDEPGQVFVSLGSLADATDVVIEYHQYVASKAEWYRIDSALTGYPQGYTE